MNKPICIPSAIINYYDGNKFVDLTFEDVYKIVERKTRMAGVYIYNNMETGNFYIGQSHDIFHRLTCHHARLRTVTAEGSWYNGNHIKHKEYKEYGDSVYLTGLILGIANKKERKSIEETLIDLTDATYNKRYAYFSTKENSFVVGKNLKSIRGDFGYTQMDVANKSGIKQPYISLIENGTINKPRRDTAEKLAAALGVTLNDLMREE